MNGALENESKHPYNIDAPGHVTGRSVYVDDLPVMENCVFARIVDSPLAHGKITRLDFGAALQMPGIIAIFSAADIPGKNQIGGIIADEPLFADKEVMFMGQPLLLVIAENEDLAEDAIEKIIIEIEPLPVITDPREAFRQNQLLSPSRHFKKGDIVKGFENAVHIFEGSAETGGQEHLYLETQGAYAFPLEQGGIKIFSSTQGLRHVQETVAHMLGLGMNMIEVDVTRLGGGFGGKEDQAAMFASMAALAVFKLNRPVKCIPHRMEDMRMTGKRNPYKSDYKIGLDADLKIVAYQAVYYQNGGAAADLSPAILERTLFHGTNSYAIPHVDMIAHSCKTNLPPNTAFRGFGGPQGMFVIEAAIDHAAKKLGVPKEKIQEANLLEVGDEFPYGQVVEQSEAKQCWNEAVASFQLDKTITEIETYNRENEFSKKGYSLMPVCFGISFTNTMMNQARALVHVYWDGSVSISTGAVEMGQGINTKMLQVAAAALGIRQEKIRIESTNTTRVANTSPSAASATADLNGKALLNACQQINARLMEVAAKLTNATAADKIECRDESILVNGTDKAIGWKELVRQAFLQRVNLSEKGHYATPEIHFDKTVEKGHPFAYHVYGTALTIVTVDCIRGTYEFDAVKVVHDFGSTINRHIDLGQVEGGIVQGMGWMTMEEVIYNENGKLLSNALSTYKIPDIYSVPRDISIRFLQTDGHEHAIFKSKAVGEPPLMYGIGAYFAVRNAILAYNPGAMVPYIAPITPEKVLNGLYSRKHE
jgi:xanthine dehydrogenase large subunit